MLSNFGKAAAVLGLALTALSLTGSLRSSATTYISVVNPSLAKEILRVNAEGKSRYSTGKYLEARALFLSAASLSQHAGDPRSAAMNWNNAGGSALALRDYRDALADFFKARQTAQASHQFVPLAITMNNLASLYLQVGNPSAAAQIAREALAGPAGSADRTIRPKLRSQLAGALARMGQFDEACAIYRQAIRELEEQGDLDSAARVLASLGTAGLEANRLNEAEAALSEGLRLVRIHRLTASANILRGLANLKSLQGDPRSAAVLFQEAIDAPESLMPRWAIYADRGRFRINDGDLPGALSDFRAARKIAQRLRADAVPADQDRIALESGLGSIAAGLVDAGNLLARQTSDRRYLRETFDAAERDKLWSLRALVPTPNDWRTRLPGNYWDLLARYQAIERSLVAQPSAEARRQAASLQLRLQEVEAETASGYPRNPFSDGFGLETDAAGSPAGSALAHVRHVLDADSVVLSFHVTKSSGWLWAVDRSGVDVYSIPALEVLKSRVAEFALAVRQGDARAVASGRELYKDLFGAVPASYLSHKRWLLELDGPLFDLPFAALVAGDRNAGDRNAGNSEAGGRKNEPIYLMERAALQAIPGALMLEPRTPAGNGEFLGVGDPVYNAADSRYRGSRGKRDEKQDVVLPRLPATAGELQACSRVWNPARTRILTGEDAGIASVRAALRSNPSVIHFATHVVTSPGDYSSGLIALSLDRSGAMGLMGPTEIAAHTVSAGLVVLNGCHSGQGDALPGAGLMGLTRAWLGAGAKSVLATRWDIPDEAGQTVMVEFYRALRARPERGAAFALRQAQLRVLRSGDAPDTAAVWAAYYLLGRE